MPIDPRIALGVQGPQIDPIGSMAKGLSMRRMMQENQAAERDQAEKMAMSDILKRNTVADPTGKVSVNRGAAMSELYKVNPEKAMAWQKQMDEMDAAQMAKVTGQAKELAWGANQDNWGQTRQRAIELGLPNADKLPEMYSPQFVERWQMGTLKGEEQLAQRRHQEDQALKYASLRDSREDRQLRTSEMKSDKRERQVEQDMQKLSKDVSGTQEMVGAIDEVEGLLGRKLETFERDKSGNLVADGKKVDLPGASVPGLGRFTAYSSEARDLNSAASRVFNATLKDRSGGAVTDNEMERLRREFNEGRFNTEAELVNALQRYKRQTAQVLKNREAGYSPDVVGRYTEQGGRTSRTMPAVQTAGGGSNFDQLSDAEIDALVQQEMQKQAGR